MSSDHPSEQEHLDPTRGGKVDVFRWVLRQAVRSGGCHEAIGVVDGLLPLDNLGTENDECIWCHLVWCIASDEDNDLTGGEENPDHLAPVNATRGPNLGPAITVDGRVDGWFEGWPTGADIGSSGGPDV